MGELGRKALRYLFIALVAVGVALTIKGRSAEIDTHRELGTKEIETGMEQRAHDRQPAQMFKNAGIALIIAGPALWFVSASFRRKQSPQAAGGTDIGLKSQEG